MAQPSTWAKNAIDQGLNGNEFVRDVLGLKNYGLSSFRAVENSAINVRQTTPDAVENIELQDLGETADRVSESIENLTEQMVDAGVGTDSQYVRDLERAHTFIGTLSGQIKISAAKISALEDGIVKLEDEKESEGITPEEIAEINENIKELTNQRDLQRNFLNDNLLPGLKSQFARIRETTNTMLYSDRTLGERVRTLFREQGITVVAIITALGMTISTLIASIIAATKSSVSFVPSPKPGPDPKPDPGPKPSPDPGPSPTPPKPEPGIKGWIKQQLQKIANLLLKLGDKMLAALPGIIGSVVSFVLKSASAAVGFVAEHLWMLAILIGGILYNYVSSLLPSPNRDKSKKNSS